MKLLEDRIQKEGKVAPGDVLRVDSFLNHQVDVAFLDRLAEELCRRFGDEKIDKVLTVEASGITIATLVALRLQVPLLFAKKAKTSNIDERYWQADCFSYTHGIAGTVMVSKEYLSAGERVLIVDDFLANGEAARAMLKLVSLAGAEAVGVCSMVEKSYQPGRKSLDDMGVRVESLARIASMDPENGVTFL